MTNEELAGMLDGTSYPVAIPKDLLWRAKAAGLVVVYGSSDDNMEFEGAVSDEVGCYGGRTVRIDAIGLVPALESVDPDDRDALRDCLAREQGGHLLTAHWCKEPGCSWTYETAIPHASFDVVEDGWTYCRGIVFRLADAG